MTSALFGRINHQTLNDPADQSPTVVFNLGMGVDSVAILLRYLIEPASRDFDLADMVVITAMTGDEWASTGADVEQHLLPLLRKYRVRFVQVARTQRLVTVAGDGVAVLSDTDYPTRLHLEGAFKLSQEMLDAGTIPQSGGARLCSVHAKGDALDPVIAQLTAGRPYRQVIGFEANEPKRAAKDAGYNTDLRTGVYPLIEWGWDRQRCVDYIASVLGGVIWEKSACEFCPFALANKEGRARVMQRYAADPAAGARTLLMEHVALALNPAQGLIGGKRLIDLMRTPEHRHVLDTHTADLAATTHAIYKVRRILRGRKDDPTKLANASRSVTAIATGSRPVMLAGIAALAAENGAAVAVGDDEISRVYLHTRADTFPAVEMFYVAAPAVVKDKTDPRFDTWWAELVGADSEIDGKAA